MQRVPALKSQGLSLQGDLQRARGDVSGARRTFTEAAAIRPSPSITSRLSIVTAQPPAPAGRHVTCQDLLQSRRGAAGAEEAAALSDQRPPAGSRAARRGLRLQLVRTARAGVRLPVTPGCPPAEGVARLE